MPKIPEWGAKPKTAENDPKCLRLGCYVVLCLLSAVGFVTAALYTGALVLLIPACVSFVLMGITSKAHVATLGDFNERNKQ